MVLVKFLLWILGYASIHLGAMIEANEISGIAGVDYPSHYDIPDTSFRCSEQPHQPGYYADPETRCQVFHYCNDNHKESFLCPAGTTFNQPMLSCDYWYSSDCNLAPNFYDVNSLDWKAKDNFGMIKSRNILSSNDVFQKMEALYEQNVEPSTEGETDFEKSDVYGFEVEHSNFQGSGDFESFSENNQGYNEDFSGLTNDPENEFFNVNYKPTGAVNFNHDDKGYSDVYPQDNLILPLLGHLDTQQVIPDSKRNLNQYESKGFIEENTLTTEYTKPWLDEADFTHSVEENTQAKLEESNTLLKRILPTEGTLTLKTLRRKPIYVTKFEEEIVTPPIVNTKRRRLPLKIADTYSESTQGPLKSDLWSSNELLDEEVVTPTLVSSFASNIDTSTDKITMIDKTEKELQNSNDLEIESLLPIHANQDGNDNAEFAYELNHETFTQANENQALYSNDAYPMNKMAEQTKQKEFNTPNIREIIEINHGALSNHPEDATEYENALNEYSKSGDTNLVLEVDAANAKTEILDEIVPTDNPRYILLHLSDLTDANSNKQSSDPSYDNFSHESKTFPEISHEPSKFYFTVPNSEYEFDFEASQPFEDVWNIDKDSSRSYPFEEIPDSDVLSDLYKSDNRQVYDGFDNLDQVGIPPDSPYMKDSNLYVVSERQNYIHPKLEDNLKSENHLVDNTFLYDKSPEYSGFRDASMDPVGIPISTIEPIGDVDTMHDFSEASDWDALQNSNIKTNVRSQNEHYTNQESARIDLTQSETNKGTTTLFDRIKMMLLSDAFLKKSESQENTATVQTGFSDSETDSNVVTESGDYSKSHKALTATDGLFGKNEEINVSKDNVQAIDASEHNKDAESVRDKNSFKGDVTTSNAIKHAKRNADSLKAKVNGITGIFKGEKKDTEQDKIDDQKEHFSVKVDPTQVLNSIPTKVKAISRDFFPGSKEHTVKLKETIEEEVPLLGLNSSQSVSLHNSKEISENSPVNKQQSENTQTVSATSKSQENYGTTESRKEETMERERDAGDASTLFFGQAEKIPVDASKHQEKQRRKITPRTIPFEQSSLPKVKALLDDLGLSDILSFNLNPLNLLPSPQETRSEDSKDNSRIGKLFEPSILSNFISGLKDWIAAKRDKFNILDKINKLINPFDDDDDDS